METQHVLNYGDNWSGHRFYSFRHNGHLVFAADNFHSEYHAKREALWHLQKIGVDVKMEDIKLEWDGCL